MVMAELPFVVLLLVLVWMADGWERRPAVFGWQAVATVVAGAGLLWIKEAGVGLIVGLVAWLVLRGRQPKALILAFGTAALMAPVLIARAVGSTWPRLSSTRSSTSGGWC